MTRPFALALAALLALAACGCADGGDAEPQPHVPPNALIREAQEADNSTPSGAVVGLLDAVIHWDMGVAAQFMTSTDEAAFSVYRTVMLPFIERIEYELGNEKIVGDTAMVDVGITAVDTAGALGELTLAAARYAITESLRGGEVDMQSFVAEYLQETLDFESLTRRKRNTTVHLVLDGMGRWRLDSSNPDNRDFYNALSGGAIDTVTDLRELAEQYNISW